MKPFNLSSVASAGVRRRAQGFTLIELLTVIAIISLLAAILLPVFAAVRENARRAACMSNLREIGAAVRQYELDNRKFPDYLLGPALNPDGTLKTTTDANAMNLQQVASNLNAIVTTNTSAAQLALIQNVQGNYATALYPTYVKDLNVFHCPNNDQFDGANTTDAVAVNRFEKGPNRSTPSVASTPAFYRFDSYDANPSLVANGNDIKLAPPSGNSYSARYARVWQPLLGRPALTSLAGSNIEQYNAYRRQLVFNNPSTDTYITMCTHHVPKGKVIVLWLSGTAKVLDTRKLNDTKFAGTNGRDVDANVLTPTNY